MSTKTTNENPQPEDNCYKALAFIVNNVEEVQNGIGGVIGYKLNLTMEQTEYLWRTLDGQIEFDRPSRGMSHENNLPPVPQRRTSARRPHWRCRCGWTGRRISDGFNVHGIIICERCGAWPLEIGSPDYEMLDTNK